MITGLSIVLLLVYIVIIDAILIGIFIYFAGPTISKFMHEDEDNSQISVLRVIKDTICFLFCASIAPILIICLLIGETVSKTFNKHFS